MKIARIDTFILRVPLGAARFYSSQAAFPERKSLLVRVETDGGLVGWGEGGQYGPAEPVAACIDAVLGPPLIGRDPRYAGRLWEEGYAASRDFGQKSVYIEALSALDIACWDIHGQAVGEPISRLLGGAFRDSIHAYATGCYYREGYADVEASLPALIAEARTYVDAGFDTLKVKIGLLRVEDDLRRVAAVRETVGDGVRLLVDTNHAYNTPTAIRMGRALEPYDIGWYEEPVPPEDRRGYRQVRDAVAIPIAGGECEFTRYGFRDFLLDGCVDIAQPDICASGGFSEWNKIYALASALGVWVIPHVWGSGVALAAALHVLAATPPFPHTHNPIPLQNEPVIEFDRSPNPLRDRLLAEPIALVGGRVPVPQGPGLGITVDEAVLHEFTRPR